jgi:hypothetical protein
MELLTPRLRLRHWQASDLAPFAAMNADPVVMEHFPAPYHGQSLTRCWSTSPPTIKPIAWIRWFTDGERRYGKELWKLASVYLPSHLTSAAYPYRKVWREGLEGAIKIKGSQGQPRVEWLNVEHPWTALSALAEVHANHLEAFNSALRRRATAYRRRQNHYAKQVEGLQRALDVQRLMHNWVRPHWSLGRRSQIKYQYHAHPFSI